MAAGLMLNLLIVAGSVSVTLRLREHYGALGRFLIFLAVQTGCMMTMDSASHAYEVAYVLTEPIGWILSALVALELAPRAGRRTLIVAAATAMCMAIPFDYGQTNLLAYFYLTERAVYFSLAVFLLAQPGRRSNPHTRIAAVYFLLNSLAYLEISMLGHGVIVAAGYALQVATVACLGAWLVVLQRSDDGYQPLTINP